jgi:hypothetical protein
MIIGCKIKRFFRFRQTFLPIFQKYFISALRRKAGQTLASKRNVALGMCPNQRNIHESVLEMAENQSGERSCHRPQ